MIVDFQTIRLSALYKNLGDKNEIPMKSVAKYRIIDVKKNILSLSKNNFEQKIFRRLSPYSFSVYSFLSNWNLIKTL